MQRWAISFPSYLPGRSLACPLGRRRWPLFICLLFTGLLGAVLPAWAETDEEPSEQALDSCAADTLAEPSLDGSYRDYEGRIIARFRYDTVGVFDTEDPSEDNFLYRFLNRLHINTRPSVLASQLLLAEGDLVNARLLAESERNLRARPYLGDARIRVDEDCGERVALVVHTRDVWTTDPTIALSRRGGETRSGFGFSEGNIAGTGNRFAIDYRDDPQRTSIGYSFHSPHLFNRQIETRISFSDNSDGQDSLFLVQRPFVSLDTKWSAGFFNEDVTQIEEIRYLGDLENTYGHALEYREAFVGWAPVASEEYTHRVSVGMSQEQHRFNEREETAGPVPDQYNLAYPWLQYHYIENRFAVYRNVDQLQRTEDVAIGADFQLRVGHGGSYFGNDYDVWRYQADYSDLIGIGEDHLLRYSLNLDGRYHKGPEQSSEHLWGGELSYHYLDGTQHRWYVAMRYDQGSNLAQHRELTAGGDYGLRGYPLDYQRGRQRYLLTLERRYVSDLHLFNLFRLGALAFVDVGRAWNNHYGSTNHLANVGVGLRMSSSKARVGHVLHLDLAYPLADRQRVDNYQLHMQASHSF